MGSSTSSEITSSEWSSISSSFTGVQNNQDNVVPGVIGFYQIDLSIAPQNRDTNWDVVEVTWNPATNAFVWTNLAGVSWSLNPISRTGGWDTTQLTVSNDNPYFVDGYTTAKIEWGVEEGVQVVTTIKGPWNWSYLRNMQGASSFSQMSTSSSSFTSSSSTSTSFSSSTSSTSTVSITTAIERKPEPDCDEKVRKIREARDEELEAARFLKEEQMLQIRTDRETEISSVRSQETMDISIVQSTRRQQIQQYTEQREQCQMENDEVTCRADWDAKIEEKRAHFEEEEEKLREERDKDIEFTRKQLEDELTKIRVEKTNEVTQTTNTFNSKITQMTQERDACEGDLESCQQKYDSEVNGVRMRTTQEIERIRLERETVINNLEIERKKKIEIIEVEQTAELDQLRAEWKVSCTDKCNVCRETQNELLQKVHDEGESKMTQIRVTYSETIRQEQLVTKEQMELVNVRSKTEIERIYAKKSGCPAVAEEEKQSCRNKLELRITETQ